ncbi:hypothetical protein ACTXT7_016225, partial [Hymenolepis weldensis]
SKLASIGYELIQLQDKPSISYNYLIKSVQDERFNTENQHAKGVLGKIRREPHIFANFSN